MFTATSKGLVKRTRSRQTTPGEIVVFGRRATEVPARLRPIRGVAFLEWEKVPVAPAANGPKHPQLQTTPGFYDLVLSTDIEEVCIVFPYFELDKTGPWTSTEGALMQLTPARAADIAKI